MTCEDPIGYESLVAYWLGESPEEGGASLEEHLFGCADCTGRLDGIVALARGVRAAVTEGRIDMVVSAPFVEAMRRAGLALREYRLDPGGSVNCTIRADDDAVISRLRAPLAGVERLDVVRLQDRGEPGVRLFDVPFDPSAGEVLLIPSNAWLKTMPAFTMRMRLIATSRGVETPLGDYTFHHMPS